MNKDYSAAEKAAYRAGLVAGRRGTDDQGPTTKYTLTIREEAPSNEVRNALQRFAANYPLSLGGRNTRGEIVLWSDNAWNVGTLREMS